MKLGILKNNAEIRASERMVNENEEKLSEESLKIVKTQNNNNNNESLKINLKSEYEVHL